MASRARQRRRVAIGLVLAGMCIGGAAVVTEFIGAEWWSAVDLKRLRQRFVVVVRSQVHIGTRGTAGFFNRGIPMEGARLVEPSRFGPEPWYHRLVPRVYSINQTDGVSVPLALPVVVLGGLGAWGFAACRRQNEGRCGTCGYDLQGLTGGVCPECGTLSV